MITKHLGNLNKLPKFGLSTFTFKDWGVNMIPHVEKRHKGGEDYFLAKDNILVVADGVGGWAD